MSWGYISGGIPAVIRSLNKLDDSQFLRVSALVEALIILDGIRRDDAEAIAEQFKALDNNPDATEKELTALWLECLRG